MEPTLQHIGAGVTSYKTPSVQERKPRIDEWNDIKLKSFHPAKKRWPTGWEKISASLTEINIQHL